MVQVSKVNYFVKQNEIKISQYAEFEKKFEMGKGQSKGLRCLIFNRPESSYGGKLFNLFI